ncbi:MAG: type II secretion system F family protein [Eubacteriales bacterium]|nr:type II secretion system F family protein [Eubacteriales bacterium]
MKIKQGIREILHWKDQWFAEERKGIEERYRAIYGSRFREELASDRKRRKKMYQLVLLLLLLAVFADIWHTLHPGVKVEYTSSGEAKKVLRPSTGHGSAALGLHVTAVSKDGSASSSGEVVIEEKGTKKAASQGEALRTETEEERLLRQIDAAKRRLNEDTSEKVIELPQHLEDGTALHWKVEHESSLALVIGMILLLMFGIYRQSTAKVRRLERDMRHSILRELPGFLNALVLLLNAGMVFESAFLRVVENYAQYKGSRKDYFYDQMREVCVSMKEANASAVSGIAAFAGRCGVREMMRIASIITDSAGKGAALAEKLGRESRMLWFMRKKRSEEKGRIAETKMTLPLMILLMVLILIAVAPAMMDM